MSSGSRVTNSHAFPEIEEVPGMWDFIAKNWASVGQTGVPWLPYLEVR